MKTGNYIIKFSKLAEKDKIKLKNSGLEKSAKIILNLMMEEPFCYPPSFEKLTGDLTGLYSKRINRQHRIVYEVDKENKIYTRTITAFDKIYDVAVIDFPAYDGTSIQARSKEY